VKPPEDRSEAERRFIAAAREAWQRHGAALLADWKPTPVREKPWALEKFGEPTCQ
jgi:hypothetical protein